MIRELTGDGSLETLATINLGGEYLSSILAVDRGARVCRTPAKIAGQLDEWSRANPTRREDFVPVFNDSDCINVRQFEIKKAGRVFGTWFLYNVVPLVDDRTRIEVRAYMVPGIPWKDRFLEWIEDMVELIAAFLEELRTDDGRAFRITKWGFPTDDASHRWSQPTNSIHAAAMQDVILPRVLARGFEKVDRVVDGVATPRFVQRTSR